MLRYDTMLYAFSYSSGMCSESQKATRSSNGSEIILISF
jgi:hypothetical protein